MSTVEELYGGIRDSLSRTLSDYGPWTAFRHGAITLDHLDFLLKAWKSEYDLNRGTASHDKPVKEVSHILNVILENLVRIEQLSTRVGQHTAIATDDPTRLRHEYSSGLEAELGELLLNIEAGVRDLNELEVRSYPTALPTPDAYAEPWFFTDQESSESLSDFDPSLRPDDNDDVQILELMLENGQTTVSAELLRASRLGHDHAVKLLLGQHEYPDLGTMRDDDDRTPIHLAALHGNVGVIDLLLNALSFQSRDLLLGAPDGSGQTALHLAAGNGQDEVVRRLLEAGADRHILNTTGETAVQVAESHCHDEIAIQLRAGTREALSRCAERHLYKPLNKEAAIRLLRITSEAEDGNVQCELVESRSHEQPYVALSWSWGDTRKSRTIIVNGQDLPVSLNLFNALLALKRHVRLEKSDYVWIDALCINQADLEERNRQVAQMASIYRDAERVIIWLGEHDEDSSSALSWLKGYAIDNHVSAEIETRHWISACRMMSRRYFSRTWVVQEIALARHATLAIGRDDMFWPDFCSAVEQFVDFTSANEDFDEQLSRYGAFLDEEAIILLSQVANLGAPMLVKTLRNIVRPRANGSLDFLADMNALLFRTSHLECAVPHDKVYAVLGMFERNDPIFWHAERLFPDDPKARYLILQAARYFMPSSRKMCDINYESPALDYATFTMMRLKTASPTNALDALLIDWAPESEKSLPSWVPHLKTQSWSRISSKDLVTFERTGAESLIRVSRGIDKNFPQYNATGNMTLDLRKTRLRQHENHSSMFVQGFVLDEITYAYASASQGTIPQEWLDVAGSLIRKDGYSHHDGWLMFCQLLLGDENIHVDDMVGKYLRQDLVDDLKLDYKGSITLSNAKRSAKPFQMRLREQARATISNRRLVMTAAGRLGLVDEMARPGDGICILYGCSVPVILRRHIKPERELLADREAELRALRGRLEKARNLIKSVIKKRRALGRPWPRANREQPPFCFVREDIWLCYMAVLSTCLLVWMRRVAPSSRILIGAICFSALFILLVNGSYILKMRILFAMAGRELVTLIAPVIWVPVGLLMDDIRTSIQPFIAFAIIAVGVVRTRIKHRRAWQKLPAKTKPGEGLERLLDTPEAKDWYTVIGQSYVHGMMNGEAIQWQAKNNIRTDTFELR